MDTNNLKNLNFRLYKALLGVETREEVLGHQDELFNQLEGIISFFENASQLDRHKFNKRKQIIEGSTVLTQDEEVLQYFALGYTLTQKDAIEIFGCYRLSAVVHRLREVGHNIENISDKRYAIYKLN
jgi:Asp-tRNA(Asn)/Glu-tRNA(Gln) amidotransferase C subunit